MCLPLLLVTNFENLELERSLRDFDFDPVANLLVDQSLSQRAGEHDFSGVVVLFARSDQCELLLIVEKPGL